MGVQNEENLWVEQRSVPYITLETDKKKGTSNKPRNLKFKKRGADGRSALARADYPMLRIFFKELKKSGLSLERLMGTPESHANVDVRVRGV